MPSRSRKLCSDLLQSAIASIILISTIVLFITAKHIVQRPENLFSLNEIVELTSQPTTVNSRADNRQISKKCFVAIFLIKYFAVFKSLHGVSSYRTNLLFYCSVGCWMLLRLRKKCSRANKNSRLCLVEIKMMSLLTSYKAMTCSMSLQNEVNPNDCFTLRSTVPWLRWNEIVKHGGKISMLEWVKNPLGLRLVCTNQKAAWSRAENLRLVTSVCLMWSDIKFPL